MALAAAGAPTSVVAQGNSCVLSGTVTARSVETGVFVDGATVSISRLSRSTTTDSTGRFRLTDLACGKQEVQVRKIGFTVWRDTVVLTAGEELSRTYTLISVAQLDTVYTKSDEIHYEVPRLQDFERRRKQKITGAFIPEAELRKLEHVSMPSILRSKIPGFMIFPYEGGQYLRAIHPTSASDRDNPEPKIDKRPNSPKGCWGTVYLDGVMIYEVHQSPDVKPPDLGQFFAMNLSGVEYYARPGLAPLQFRTTLSNCPILLLWTRGR